MCGDIMLKVAVVDDENIICSQIEGYLLQISKELNIRLDIEVLYSGKELCKELEQKTNYDVIFLDIEMKNTNGIEASHIIREIMMDDGVQIVYVSGKTQYAMELFKFSPFDFIVKPVQKEKLKEVIQKVLRILGNKDYFSYKKGRETLRVQLKDIIYFESNGRKVDINTVEGKDTFIAVMKEIENKLENVGFISIHRSFLVNYRHIKKFSFREVVMSNGEKLTISKERREKIQQLQLELESGDEYDG